MTDHSDLRTEHGAMLHAAQIMHLDPDGATLVSASSRFMWHLPGCQVALALSRPNSKTLDDLTAEASAVHAAVLVGVRAPQIMAEPILVGESRYALAFQWIAGRRLTTNDWRSAAAEAARIGRADVGSFRAFQWPKRWPDPRWRSVLGAELCNKLERYALHSAGIFDEMIAGGSVAPAHCDLQPGNYLVDDADRPWLIDFEYAGLAPSGWDLAKLEILSKRFGDPPAVGDLLPLWSKTARCGYRDLVDVQETLLVGWLTDMALQGTGGAAEEARRRVHSLGNHGDWKHLRADVGGSYGS